MLKILVISTVPLGTNGITNVIMNINYSKINADIKCDLLSSESEFAVSERVREYGGKIIILSRSVRHPITYINRLRKIMQQYDVVHVHGNSSSMLLELIAANLANVKKRIVHSHSMSCNNIYIHKILRPLLCKMSNMRLACSQESGVWTYGCSDFQVVKNSIKAEEYAFSVTDRERIRSMLSIDEDFVVYGNVGEFASEKNHTFLIDIFNSIYLKQKKSILILVGDGRLMPEIRNKIKSLNLEKSVLLLGKRNDVKKILNAMDYFIFPSIHEGFGIVALEAQANGLPVFASENISKEVKVSSNFCYLPLKSGPEKWAMKILDYPSDRNVDGVKNVIEAGFDCNTTRDFIYSLYKKED